VASPSSSDAFGLLGIPPSFDVDLGALEKAYFDRSKAVNPDRATAAERIAALTQSRALNDAYQTLKKPIARAEYLLARAGVLIGDNERLDPAFLMEILEAREELAEARGDRARVEAMQKAMKARRDATIAELPALFAAGDLAEVKKRVIVLRYLGRYLEECDAALDED